MEKDIWTGVERTGNDGIAGAAGGLTDSGVAIVEAEGGAKLKLLKGLEKATAGFVVLELALLVTSGGATGS